MSVCVYTCMHMRVCVCAHVHVCMCVVAETGNYYYASFCSYDPGYHLTQWLMRLIQATVSSGPKSVETQQAASEQGEASILVLNKPGRPAVLKHLSLPPIGMEKAKQLLRL